MVELLFFLVFLCGLLLKIVHMPFDTTVMALGLVSMLLYYVISLVRMNNGRRRSAGWLGLATVSWLIFFMAELKFMGGTLILMGLALFVSILSLLMTLRESGPLSPGRIFVLLLALFLSASTSWMDMSTRYYVFNIHFRPDMHADYQTLDTYSWFLYKDRFYDKALLVNARAYEAAKTSGAVTYLPKVQAHHEAILLRNWGRKD